MKEIQINATRIMNEPEVKEELMAVLNKVRTQEYYLSLGDIVNIIRGSFREEEIKIIKEKL